MPREYFGCWSRTYSDWSNTETTSDETYGSSLRASGVALSYRRIARGRSNHSAYLLYRHHTNGAIYSRTVASCGQADLLATTKAAFGGFLLHSKAWAHPYVVDTKRLDTLRTRVCRGSDHRLG
jgi:hypothetical protein